MRQKITDAVAHQYHGAGWALAAIVGGEVVAIRYIADIAPEIDEQLDTDHASFFIRQWLNAPAAAPHVRELQALGSVSVGMCSAWEFVGQ